MIWSMHSKGATSISKVWVLESQIIDTWPIFLQIPLPKIDWFISFNKWYNFSLFVGSSHGPCFDLATEDGTFTHKDPQCPWALSVVGMFTLYVSSSSQHLGMFGFTFQLIPMQVIPTCGLFWVSWSNSASQFPSWDLYPLKRTPQL